MALRIWRLIAITLMALSMGLAFSHALELRPKMDYDAALYLTLHRTLYVFYGKIGGYMEVGAVAATLVLAYLVRNRRPAYWPTVIGAALMALAHAVFWIWVAPTNTLMASWPVNAPPTDWVQVRNQWEYAHLARFFLQLAALVALELSILRETPLEAEAEAEVEAEAVDTAAEPHAQAGMRRRIV